MLHLKDVLQPEAIITELTSVDRRGVLQEFAQLATGLIDGLDKTVIFDTLSNREKLGSTAVGHGVAIPHGKLAGLNRVVTLFGRSQKGVDFQSHDQKPTHLFFVLLAPEDSVGTDLHVLARLSRLIKDEKTCEHLSGCQPECLYQVLVDEDDKL